MKKKQFLVYFDKVWKKKKFREKKVLPQSEQRWMRRRILEFRHHDMIRNIINNLIWDRALINDNSFTKKAKCYNRLCWVYLIYSALSTFEKLMNSPFKSCLKLEFCPKLNFKFMILWIRKFVQWTFFFEIRYIIRLS